jgi:hypothetical protein
MSGTRDHHIKWNKPDSERQISHIFAQMWNLDIHMCVHIYNMSVNVRLLGNLWGEEGKGESDGHVKKVSMIKIHCV